MTTEWMPQPPPRDLALVSRHRENICSFVNTTHSGVYILVAKLPKSLEVCTSLRCIYTICLLYAFLVLTSLQFDSVIKRKGDALGFKLAEEAKTVEDTADYQRASCLGD